MSKNGQNREFGEDMDIPIVPQGASWEEVEKIISERNFPRCKTCQKKHTPKNTVRYLGLHYCNNCIDEKKHCNFCSKEHNLEIFQYCALCETEYCYMGNCKCAEEITINPKEKFNNCPNKGKVVGEIHGSTYNGKCKICHYPLIIKQDKHSNAIGLEIHPNQIYCNCGCKFDLLKLPPRIFCKACEGTWKVEGSYCLDCDNEISKKQLKESGRCDRCLEFYIKHSVSYRCGLCGEEPGIGWAGNENEPMWGCYNCKLIQEIISEPPF